MTEGKGTAKTDTNWPEDTGVECCNLVTQGNGEKEKKIPLDPLWCNSTYMRASAIKRMWQEWWKGNQMTLRTEDWQLEWNEHLVGSTETVMAMLASYRRAWEPLNILLHSLCREISNATKFSWSNLWKVFKPRRKTSERKTSKNESNNGAPTQAGVKVFPVASTSEWEASVWALFLPEFKTLRKLS